MGRPSSVGRAVASLLVLVTALARPAKGQEELLQRLNIDKLQIASLGAGIGRVMPSQVEPATLVGIQADYGNIAPSWRVVFGASYWSSRYRDDVVQAFLDTLQHSLSDPSGHVVPSRITVYDVTFDMDMRYAPLQSAAIKPFLGVGVAAHVINAEGKLIKGTFVERSLDDIAAGLSVSGGFAIQLVSHFGIDASARADLMSGFRSTQVRAGASYYFGQLRGTSTNAGNGRTSGGSR